MIYVAASLAVFAGMFVSVDVGYRANDIANCVSSSGGIARVFEGVQTCNENIAILNRATA